MHSHGLGFVPMMLLRVPISDAVRTISCRHCALDGPGFWSLLDWYLHHQCGRPITQYLRISTECASNPSLLHRWGPNRTRCVEVNAELLATLDGATMLMLGDSTSASTYLAGCQVTSNQEFQFIATPPPASMDSTLTQSDYYHLQRGGSMHHCHFSKLVAPSTQKTKTRVEREEMRAVGGPSLGSFIHYGVIGPPYWAAAYPLAPFLAGTTLEQVAHDLPSFCKHAAARCQRGSPDVIVLSSGLWDLESLWLHEGNKSKSFQLSPEHIHLYVRRVRRLVAETHRIFPHSKLVWRTLHPVGAAKWGGGNVHPASAAALNEAVRAHAPSWSDVIGDDEGLEIFDAAALLQQLMPTGLLQHARLGPAGPVGTMDGRQCAHTGHEL